MLKGLQNKHYCKDMTWHIDLRRAAQYHARGLGNRVMGEVPRSSFGVFYGRGRDTQCEWDIERRRLVWRAFPRHIELQEIRNAAALLQSRRLNILL
ncbi:hypothetical protein E4U43_001627 [Claviceps pusilla]|uniref:Uncharacterized protein n=1 Tax=Claviceps pusilla TaxID=123648 RepID=A0A9P7SZ34_9HYPO|nr:hypothetical protein E4U43_001627 [Claviceps pusilla]